MHERIESARWFARTIARVRKQSLQGSQRVVGPLFRMAGNWLIKRKPERGVVRLGAVDLNHLIRTRTHSKCNKPRDRHRQYGEQVIVGVFSDEVHAPRRLHKKLRRVLKLLTECLNVVVVMGLLRGHKTFSGEVIF